MCQRQFQWLNVGLFEHHPKHISIVVYRIENTWVPHVIKIQNKAEQTQNEKPREGGTWGRRGSLQLPFQKRVWEPIAGTAVSRGHSAVSSSRTASSSGSRLAQGYALWVAGGLSEARLYRSSHFNPAGVGWAVPYSEGLGWSQSPLDVGRGFIRPCCGLTSSSAQSRPPSLHRGWSLMSILHPKIHLSIRLWGTQIVTW